MFNRHSYVCGKFFTEEDFELPKRVHFERVIVLKNRMIETYLQTYPLQMMNFADLNPSDCCIMLCCSNGDYKVQFRFLFIFIQILLFFSALI